MLVQYIRNPVNNAPYGAVVAIGPGEVGWSLCHRKDRFSKKIAVEIAAGRAAKGTNVVPYPLDAENLAIMIERMRERSLRYYKPNYNLITN